jgi:hypothetical protein
VIQESAFSTFHLIFEVGRRSGNRPVGAGHELIYPAGNKWPMTNIKWKMEYGEWNVEMFPDRTNVAG